MVENSTKLVPPSFSKNEPFKLNDFIQNNDSAINQPYQRVNIWLKKESFQNVMSLIDKDSFPYKKLKLNSKQNQMNYILSDRLEIKKKKIYF